MLKRVYLTHYRWLQEAIHHNESTTPHEVLDILPNFPMQFRAMSGGLRAPGTFCLKPIEHSNFSPLSYPRPSGKLYLDRRRNLTGIGPLPDMPAPEGAPTAPPVPELRPRSPQSARSTRSPFSSCTHALRPIPPSPHSEPTAPPRGEAAGLEGARTASAVTDSLAGETAGSFGSYTLLKSEKRQHRRLRVGPTDLFREPVSAAMAVGWRTVLEDPAVRPRPRGRVRARAGAGARTVVRARGRVRVRARGRAHACLRLHQCACGCASTCVRAPPPPPTGAIPVRARPLVTGSGPSGPLRTGPRRGGGRAGLLLTPSAAAAARPVAAHGVRVAAVTACVLQP
jgi:hypothetical protein